MSTNVPHLTSVTAVLRVKIPTDHTSAPVTAGTLEMDARAEVPCDLVLSAQFFRDCNKNMIHLEMVGSKTGRHNVNITWLLNIMILYNVFIIYNKMSSS